MIRRGLKSVFFDIVIIGFISIMTFFITEYAIGYYSNLFLNIPNNFLARTIRIGRVSFIVNLVFLFTYFYLMLTILRRLNIKKYSTIYIISIIPIIVLLISDVITMRFTGRAWNYNDLQYIGTGINALSGQKFFYTKELIIGILLLIIIFLLLLVVDKILDSKNCINSVEYLFFSLILASIVSFCSIFSYNNYLFGDMFIDDPVYTRGIIGSLLYSYKSRYKRPSHYTKEKIISLYEKYKDNTLGKKKINSDKFKNKNVIIIVEESMSQMFNGKFENEDFPNINTTKNVYKGNLYIYNAYGFTALSEWELFTGLSISRMYKGDENLINDTIIKRIKKMGYKTNALHFCSEDVYRYKTFYTNVGFDNVLFKKDGEFQYPLTWLPTNDIDTFNNLLKVINDNDDKKEKNLYYVVTTSAHDLSVADLYKDYNPNYKINSLSEQDNIWLNEYLTLMRKNDDDIKYLLNELKKKDEEYLVLVFGDHPFKFPSGLKNNFVNSYEESTTTPFMFWSNKNRITDDKEDVYTIPYLYLDLLDMLGAKDIPLLNFLRYMRENISSMNDNTFFSKRLNRFIEYKDANEVENELLNDYAIINASYYEKEDKDIFFGD